MLSPAGPRSGMAPRPSRSRFWARERGVAMPVCLPRERGVFGLPGGSHTDGAALGVVFFFLASGKVTSEEKGLCILFN